MYRMYPYNRSTPRDCLDPRMLDRLMEQSHLHNEGGCGCEAESQELRQERSSCSVCNNERIGRNTDPRVCGCENDHYPSEFNYALAMVYSPKQEWQNLYCEEEGMKAGTIFKELDKPFYGSKCHGGNCHE